MPHHHPSEETTPSKATLRAWWKQFTAKNAKRENEPKGKGKLFDDKKLVKNKTIRLLILE
jgi:hypothetical protein